VANRSVKLKNKPANFGTTWQTVHEYGQKKTEPRVQSTFQEPTKFASSIKCLIGTIRTRNSHDSARR